MKYFVIGIFVLLGILALVMRWYPNRNGGSD